MKTGLKKIFAVAVSLIMVLSMSISAFASNTKREDGFSSVGGVEITTKADKEKYRTGDTAKFTITIENTNGYELNDFQISYTLPENFEVDESKLTKKIATLGAKEKTSFEVSAVVSSETDAGGVSPIIIGAVVAAVVVLVILVIVILMKNKKGKNTAISSILIMALLGGSVFGIQPETADAAETDYEVKNNFSRVSVHDPSIVKDPATGTYYVFGSHRAWAKSDDLMSWKVFTNNISTNYQTIFADVWDNYCTTAKNNKVDGNLWAPDVIWNDTMKKWCMYMSVNGDNWQSAIVLLTADSLEGDWTYVGPVVFSGFFDYATFGNESTTATLNQERAAYSDVYKVLGEGADLTRYSKTSQFLINCIDPNVCYDKDGNLWMTYGSWSGGVYQLKLDLATGLRDYEKTYETEVNVSDAYLGYKIAGGFYNSGEGPYIVKVGDYYYLYLSIGNLEAARGYSMRIFRSESINGPFVDQNGKTAITKQWINGLGFSQNGVYTSNLGVKPFGAYTMYGINTIQVAQGHNSAFVDDDGKAYVIYHTRFASGGEGHQVRVHQMFVNQDGWLVTAPYEYSGETISADGYTEEEILGTYEWVYHNPAKSYNGGGNTDSGIVGGGTEKLFVKAEKTITVGSEELKLVFRVDFQKSAAEKITLEAGGKVTGALEGTWKSDDKLNLTLTVGGVEYKGVFLKQANEYSDRNMTMTFSVLGKNNTAWGVKELK